MSNRYIPCCVHKLHYFGNIFILIIIFAHLTQSLLLSMEISRHGCNPTAQLGNALVVSLFIWVGLSALYRLLAFIVAPSIEFKHCLCMTGYGFFAWNLALLCSFPLENFKDSIAIPTMVPLVLFGLPSSIAQVGVHCVMVRYPFSLSLFFCG